MSRDNITYLDNIDTELVTQLLDKTEQNVNYFNSITEQVVKAYSHDLDQLMIHINEDINSKDELDIDSIEKYYIELTNILYFMGSKLEQLGIRNDMSKAAKQEVFNKAYMSNLDKDVDRKNKTTVAENNAKAEQASQYESVINSIYDRAYRQIKYKIDGGYEMVKTLSKILSRRMQDIDVSRFQPRTTIAGEM